MTETAVAIVNHQPVLCESLSAFISGQSGLRIVGSASTAEQVAELIGTRRPDVLILDVEFDSTFGIDMLKHLRSMPSSPAVVLLMSDADIATARQALQMGTSGFVLKAAPIRDLLEAIRWAAKGQMWMSPPLLTELLQGRSDEGLREAKNRLAMLTRRELDVLCLLVEGLSQMAISARLYVTANTVRTHSQNLQKKLGVHSAVAAVSVAREAGLRPAA